MTLELPKGSQGPKHAKHASFWWFVMVCRLFKCQDEVMKCMLFARNQAH